MEIETERLFIRSFTQHDIEAYWHIVSDERVTRFLGDGTPHDFKTAADYVFDCIKLERNGSPTRYAVVSKQTGKLIGFSGYKRMSEWLDFGYRFSFESWGQGLATEAGGRILRYGRDELAVSKTVARVAEGNAASIAVLRKLGFQDWQDQPVVDGRFRWLRLTS